MKILEKRRSVEPCEEAGWVAFDWLLDAPMERQWIQGLRGLGALTHLVSLRRPFFKVEAAHFMLKGLEGDACLRVAAHHQHLGELEGIEMVLEEASDGTHPSV